MLIIFSQTSYPAFSNIFLAFSKRKGWTISASDMLDMIPYLVVEPPTWKLLHRQIASSSQKSGWTWTNIWVATT